MLLFRLGFYRLPLAATQDTATLFLRTRNGTAARNCIFFRLGYRRKTNDQQKARKNTNSR